MVHCFKSLLLIDKNSSGHKPLVHNGSVKSEQNEPGLEQIICIENKTLPLTSNFGTLCSRWEDCHFEAFTDQH